MKVLDVYKRQGRYIVDMGQNMVGIQQVKLRGKKDKPITMRFAEVLKDNGTELYLSLIHIYSFAYPNTRSVMFGLDLTF